MFRNALRPLSVATSVTHPRGAWTARYLHRATADFLNHDSTGKLVAKKTPVFVRNPGGSFVLIDIAVGTALRAAHPKRPPTTGSVEDRCKFTYFHDSEHFGFGKMIEIIIDGTADADFAEKANATRRELEGVLELLKNM
ncbi:hypothetical protein BDW69DRAFT_197772 [Aspergillus filifer]